MLPKMNVVKKESPKPAKPVSKKTKGPAGGCGPGYYNPAAAAKFLNQESPKVSDRNAG